ncbi:MAG TPA: thiamine phosphate synthase, partial [Sandaracinaceae bacterium]
KGPALGIDGFAEAVRSIAIDVYALGGVGAAHVSALREAGARGVAVVRAVYAAPDPAAAARALLAGA